MVVCIFLRHLGRQLALLALSNSFHYACTVSLPPCRSTSLPVYSPPIIRSAFESRRSRSCAASEVNNPSTRQSDSVAVAPSATEDAPRQSAKAPRFISTRKEGTMEVSIPNSVTLIKSREDKVPSYLLCHRHDRPAPNRHRLAFSL